MRYSAHIGLIGISLTLLMKKIHDGRRVCEEGILAELYRKLESYPRICYHGGRILGMTSVQSRLRAETRRRRHSR